MDELLLELMMESIKPPEPPPPEDPEDLLLYRLAQQDATATPNTRQKPPTLSEMFAGRESELGGVQETFPLETLAALISLPGLIKGGIKAGTSALARRGASRGARGLTRAADEGVDVVGLGRRQATREGPTGRRATDEVAQGVMSESERAVAESLNRQARQRVTSGETIHDPIKELRRFLDDQPVGAPKPAASGPVAPALTEAPLPKSVCAWCKSVLREGPEPISHGICPTCESTLLQ